MVIAVFCLKYMVSKRHTSPYYVRVCGGVVQQKANPTCKEGFPCPMIHTSDYRVENQINVETEVSFYRILASWNFQSWLHQILESTLVAFTDWTMGASLLSCKNSSGQKQDEREKKNTFCFLDSQTHETFTRIALKKQHFLDI